MEKLALPLAVAAILGVAGLTYSWASGGGAVTAMNGVSRDELEATRQQLEAKIAAVAEVPADAVIAVSTATGCPSPWKEYAPLQGRVIIGAGAGFATGDDGGTGEFTLEAANLPPHQHETMLTTPLATEQPFGAGEPRNPGLKSGGPSDTWKTTMTSVFPSEPAKPVKLLPPYRALTFCSR